ncbi:MAG: thymidylate kinase [Candidatus Moranbacteria bacterium]|nr:thymidylate kinase [Candidatus Moranbacteria bacterium]
MKKKRGLFIVLDGTDGSGKATQTKLLVKRLVKKGYKVKELDFPQYGEKSAALVEEYLNGEYGTAEEVGPYRASIFYACDRYAAGARIKKWLDEGKIVISNRYVTANMGHQGGKLKKSSERKKYFQWLYNLEYKMFEIPKPDINLILHVEASVAQKLALQKRKQSYLKNNRADIHERDLKHLKDAEKVYIEIAHTIPHISLIECMKNGNLMSREDVSGLVWNKISRLLR